MLVIDVIELIELPEEPYPDVARAQLIIERSIEERSCLTNLLA